MQGRRITLLLGLVYLTSRIRTQMDNDLDKCAVSTVCPPYAICINIPGNYTCVCKNGFVMGPTMECQDVDECSQNPLICGPNTKCTNIFGKYKCSCLSGFSSPRGNSWVPGKTGPFQCTDINECLRDSVCPQHSTCQNTPGSYRCPCNAGFIFRNSQCEDVDECADSTVCPPYAMCINTPGNYTCECKNGFVMGPRMECQDVDECSQNPLICGPNTKCANVIGKYRCSCLSGFSSLRGNFWVPGKTGPFQCTDINECLRDSACPQHSTCQNTPGSYSCPCNPGFIFRTSQCEDVDECADSTVCPPFAICINTPGNYTCECKNGFVMGPRMECQDMDECSQDPLICGPNTKCSNVIGKYRCSCLSGFSSPRGNFWVPGKTGPFQCTDINECLKESACPQHSTCQNTPGSYGCPCNAGFTFRNSQCEDVDECADSTVCPQDAICINTPGNYTCDCKNGFVMGPRMECQDVDECSQDPLICGPNTKCSNVIGKYRCSCLSGFSSPRGNFWVPGKTGPFQCTDINECLRDSACPQHSTCQNTPGSYGCPCNAGFTFRNSQCEDVDECADSTVCPQDAICINTPGNYTCDCKNGFVMGPRMECQDVDECSQDPLICGPNTKCSNVIGKYRCSCLSGFSSPRGNFWVPGKTGPFQCTDVDECADSTVCPQDAICINTPGNYTCDCKNGFVMGPRMECQDVDECSQNPLICGPNTKCSNVIGKYRCSCLSGFSSPRGNFWVPGKTGPFQCTDINECLRDSACPQHSTCQNTPGSYGCPCNAGFTFRNSQCEDVDECMDATACPAHATCTNTLGNYFCTCKNGYKSSTSEVNFRGQGTHCEDDFPTFRSSSRCLNLKICPDNSSCKETESDYYCICNPGFELASGGHVFTDPKEKCEDVDECADSTVCPPYAICKNNPGNYTCDCKSGFVMGSGMKCQDVDECSQNPLVCGLNTKCTNVIGKYSCSCLSGFSSPRGNSWIPGKTGPFQCTDVNECLNDTACPQHYTCWNTLGSYNCTCNAGFTLRNSQCEDIDECMDAKACPTHATCTNTLGNYFCTCKNGYKSSTSEVSFQGQGTQCKRILVRCKEDLVDQEKVKHCQSNSTHPVLPEYIFYCKLVDSILEDTCENKTTNVSLKKAAENFASVLEETSTWHILKKEETSTLATVFLDSVENVTLSAIVGLSRNTSQTVKNKYLEIESKVIQDNCLVEYLVLSAKGDSMKIDCSTINESVSKGTLSDITGIAFTSFVGMESILNEKFFYNSEANLIGSSQNLRMNSRVIGGIITGDKKENFSNPVIYTLENLQPKKKSDRSICISWDPEFKGGRWTSTGCVVLSSNETHTICSCSHLANMAVIMASGEITVDFTLFLISHVGMILSLLCLVLAIITFLLCRSIRSHITTLHLHLCICLFLAKLLFLIGVVRTENKIVCAVIAGLLHYLFLACFAWMLVEAMMLFLMVRNLKVVNYFSSRNIKMLYLYIFGYGLPALIVLVSAGIQWEDYGMDDRCWLNTETGFIWSFLGPVCLIILINSVLLTGTLWILRKKLSTVNADISTLKDNRLLTFKAFAQLFILGCSWILGIFQIGPIASIMAYLFTIINSLQGTFIFIIHCVLNRQVREEYKRCFTCRTKASTTSQTSGILLSSMSSTSKTG